MTDSACNSRQSGSPTLPPMEDDLAIRLLFAVSDGELTVRDVRVLMARYAAPDAGTKAVSKQTGIPVSTVRRSFRRLQRIAKWTPPAA